MSTQVIPDNTQFRSRPGFWPHGLLGVGLALSFCLERIKEIGTSWHRDVHWALPKMQVLLVMSLLISEEKLPFFLITLSSQHCLWMVYNYPTIWMSNYDLLLNYAKFSYHHGNPTHGGILQYF